MCKAPGWKGLSPKHSCCVCYDGTFQLIHGICKELKGHGASVPSLGLQTSSPDPQASHFCFISPRTGFEQGVRLETRRGPFQPKLFNVSLWISEWASAFVSLNAIETRSGGGSMLSALLCKVKEVSWWGCPISAGGFSVGLAGPRSAALLLMHCTTAASPQGVRYRHIQAFPTCSVLVATEYSSSNQAAV